MLQTPSQFSAHLRHALKEEPQPLSPAELRSASFAPAGSLRPASPIAVHHACADAHFLRHSCRLG